MRTTFAGAVVAGLVPLTAWAAFSVPFNVSGNPGQSAAPSLSADPPMVIWADNTDETGQPDASFRLRYAAYPSSGPAGIIPGIESLDESLLPRSVVDRGTGEIHVVFQNRILGRYDIFHVSSPDQGATWTAPANVSNNAGDSVTPQIDIDDSGALHAVWSDDTGLGEGAEIFHSRRNPVTGTWSLPVNVSNRPTTPSAFPDVAASRNGLANVAWIDGSSGGTSVFFSRERPDGSFTGGHNISGQLFTGPLGQSAPDLVRGTGDSLHLVWAGAGSADGTEVYYQFAASPTSAFSPPKNVSWSPGASATPAVAVDSANQAHVVWADNPTDPQGSVRYVRVVPGGAATSPAAVAMTGRRSLLPDVVTDADDGIRVCWQEDLGSFPAGNFEILCAEAPEAVPPWTDCGLSPPPDPQCGGFTTDPVTVSLTSTDNSGSVSNLSYRIDNGPATNVSFGTCPTAGPFSESFSVGGEGSHRIRYFAGDCAGNVSAEAQCVVKIDTVAPATTARVLPGCGDTCPVHPGPVRVHLEAIDPEPASGVRSTQYRLDGGPWTTYGGSLKVASDGPHTVEFFSEDAACNVEPMQQIQFEVLGGLTVQIVRPRPGALYLNDEEIVDTDAALAPTVVGSQLTFEVIVTTPDGADVNEVIVAQGGQIRGIDTTDRPSGSTYSITTAIPSATLTLSEVITVTVIDVTGRRGQKKIGYTVVP